jgi:tripartite-type tricarboxylate transporter receptor subunit TctC
LQEIIIETRRLVASTLLIAAAGAGFAQHADRRHSRAGTALVKHNVHLRLAFASLMLAAACAGAQTFPNRPLRLIVPFPPGGGSDAVGRIIAQPLVERLGQQIVVDNRAGAGGSIGTEAAVRANADGHTMVLASTSEIAINPALYRLGYDPLRDLLPVAVVASAAMVLVVAPASGIDSVKGLVAMAKAKPGALNIASAGNGTITHLSGELLRSLTGSSWTHVAYKGAPPALSDLAAGRVEGMISSLPAAMPLIKSGRIRAVAVSTRARQPSLPQVPTVTESGVPQYDVMYWYGLFVPSATPSVVAARLAQEITQSLRQKGVISNLENQGAVPGELVLGEFARFVQSEHARWSHVVKSSGAKAG